ncbi:hypothetical protein B0H16DRAFT_1878550, partial [Mycena metata]
MRVELVFYGVLSDRTPSICITPRPLPSHHQHPQPRGGVFLPRRLKAPLKVAPAGISYTGISPSFNSFETDFDGSIFTADHSLPVAFRTSGSHPPSSPSEQALTAAFSRRNYSKQNMPPWLLFNQTRHLLLYFILLKPKTDLLDPGSSRLGTPADSADLTATDSYSIFHRRSSGQEIKASNSSIECFRKTPLSFAPNACPMLESNERLTSLCDALQQVAVNECRPLRALLLDRASFHSPTTRRPLKLFPSIQTMVCGGAPCAMR